MKYSRLTIANLKRGELFTRFDYRPWSDKDIPTGAQWRKEIDDAIHSARIAVLVVSSDFLASEFILEHEIPPLFDRESRGELAVFALIVRPCVWQTTQWLNEFQVYPSATPLSKLTECEYEERLQEFVLRIDEQLDTEASAASESVAEAKKEAEEAQADVKALLAAAPPPVPSSRPSRPPILPASPSPSKDPREEKRPGGLFYTWVGIQDLIRVSGRLATDEHIEKGLLLFRTKTQRMWLVASESRLFCVLDGEKTRARKRLIQWSEPRGEIEPIRARARSSSSITGLVDIGSHRNWLYSKSLHKDPSQLVALVRDLANP